MVTGTPPVPNSLASGFEAIWLYTCLQLETRSLVLKPNHYLFLDIIHGLPTSYHSILGNLRDVNHMASDKWPEYHHRALLD